MSRRFFLYILTIFLYQASFSQGMNFEKLNLKQGLSQISVTCMTQDSRGAMWIGTRDGLNLYDGYNIKILKKNKKYSNSLLSSKIKEITIFEKDKLLVLTKRGVSILDIKTDDINNYPNDNTICSSILDNTIYIGTNFGLSILDTKTKKYIAASKIFPYHIKINYLFYDKEHNLYISTEEKGLFSYNFKSKKLKNINKYDITCIYKSKNNTLWLGSKKNGIFSMLNNKIQEHYNTKSGLSNNTVRAITEDKYGNIWVGSFYGLSILNPNNGKIKTHYQSTNNKKGLSNNSIYSLFNDRDGSIWIGSYFGGINIYSQKENIFRLHTVQDNNKSLNYRVIGSTIQDDSKNLWIATEGGGLNYFNRETNTFEYITKGKDKKHLSHNNIKSLYLDKQTNKLWIGTHTGGLNVMDLRTREITKYKTNTSDSSSILNNTILCIIPFLDNILLGTYNGLIIYNKKDKTFKYFFESKKMRFEIGNKILSLLIDKTNKLWIGSENKGLSSFDINNNKFVNYKDRDNGENSLSNNPISKIYQDHMGRIWIGTYGGGLNRYLPRSDSFKNYKIKELNSDTEFINGIAESRYGYLWVARSKGLCRLDIENETFENYNYKNGFPLYEINEGGLLVCMDGEVFVGGMRGMVSFKEKQLNKKAKKHQVYITDIKVNNKQIHNRSNTGIIDKNVSYASEINLGYKQNILNISFSSFNYVKTNRTRYLYKLDGFDKEWVDIKYRHMVTYTNLEPGEYTFRVKEKSDNKYYNTERTININVSPAFYASWPAYLFYLILLILSLKIINKFLISKAILEQKLITEKKEKIKVDKINQSKLDFFTNISHEFRTPLTLVLGSLENLIVDTSETPSVNNKINLAYKNAYRLQKLIDELLEFRKYDQNYIKLKISEYDIVQFSKDIFDSFSNYALQNSIYTNFVCRYSKLNAWIDASEMEKVLFNLLSNALKFTPSNGSVNLFVDVRDNHIHIKIIDSGKGFSKEEKERIFDYFYQTSNSDIKNKGQKGSGIGLALTKSIIELHGGKIEVESNINEGSCFEIIIPQGKEHFSKEELISENNYKIDDRKEELILDIDKEDIEYDNIMESEKEYQVLIIEDNPDVRNMLTSVFSKKYKLLEASNGEEGLKLATEYLPNLIISDVMMPIMSGTELCKTLKSDIQTSHIPIILLTAKSSLKQELSGLEHGADDYITKPFNFAILMARVKNLLDSRKGLHNKFRSDPEFGCSNVSKSKLDIELISRAKKIIEDNIDNSRFDVNTFAKEMCMGRTSLYSKVKGITGQTPNDFILTIRLKKAAFLFRSDSKHSVTDVAYAVGFSTPRYFSKCFSEQFGVPPSKYAKGERSNEKNDTNI